MTIEEKAQIIRLMITGVIISEYALLSLKDNTKQDLKARVNIAINACRGVQKWFTCHEQSDSKTAKLFEKQFNSNEIVMLTELLQTCFPLDEHGISEVIKAVREAIEIEQK